MFLSSSSTTLVFNTFHESQRARRYELLQNGRGHPNIQCIKLPRCLSAVCRNGMPWGRHRLLCNALRMSRRSIPPFTRWETNWYSTGDLLAQHLHWLYPHLLTTILLSTIMFSSSRAFDCTPYNWDLNNGPFSVLFRVDMQLWRTVTQDTSILESFAHCKHCSAWKELSIAPPTDEIWTTLKFRIFNCKKTLF